MRVFNLGVSRPAWYDRGPLEKGQYYQGVAVAPHGGTTRWTYTVPAARKAYIEACFADIMRITAAGVVSLATATFVCTLNGAQTSVLGSALLFNNTLGTFDKVIVNGTITLLAGSVIAAQTSDASTGGTNNYDVSYKATEFDA
jgi:hypothetical protein